MTTIRVIDFETTGTDDTAKVIEYGWCDYDVETREIGEPKSNIYRVDAIAPESRAVHHIAMSDIPVTAAPFDAGDVIMPADEMAITFFAAHSAKFEARFLGDLEHRRLICTYKSALRVWPDAPAHSNGALRYWLEDQGKIAPDHVKTQPAHRAGPDAYVTAHILKALFEAGATGKDMVGWAREPVLMPRCPIGKFRGKPWSEVEDGFLGWMMRQDDMDEDLKWNADREIRRRSQA